MHEYEHMDRRVLAILAECADEEDVLNLLIRVAASACPDLDENQIQEYLCDVAVALERAAGRADYDDSAWVTYTVNRGN